MCTIKEVTKCDGEASANNRKAKLIFFYEWIVNGEWEGCVKDSDNKTNYKGTFEIPNLSEEHDPEDVDINITIKNDKQHRLKDFMRTEGVKKIREQLAKYIVLLREGSIQTVLLFQYLKTSLIKLWFLEFSQGLILPTKDSSSNLKNLATTTTAPDKKAQSSTSEVKVGHLNGSTKIETKKLTMNEEFKCRASELYQVFVDANVSKPK